MTPALLSATMSLDDVAVIVRARLTDLGRSQAWLGAEVAAILERDQPFGQTTISTWLTGVATPEPEQVFAMERALGLRGGDLSRLLGYLPVSARSEPVGTEATISADPRLSDAMKRALIAAYREMRD